MTTTTPSDMTMTVTVRAATRTAIDRARQDIRDDLIAGFHGQLVTADAGQACGASYTWTLDNGAGR